LPQRSLWRSRAGSGRVARSPAAGTAGTPEAALCISDLQKRKLLADNDWLFGMEQFLSGRWAKTPYV